MIEGVVEVVLKVIGVLRGEVGDGLVDEVWWIGGINGAYV